MRDSRLVLKGVLTTILVVIVGTTFPAMGQSFPVSVTSSGSGSGVVTSSPSGISCGSTCSASFATGTTVTLTATPSSGSVFTGWSGAGCLGTGTCTFSVTSAVSVNAAFSPYTPPAITPFATSADTLSLTNHFSIVAGTLNSNGDYAVVANSQGLFWRPLNGSLARVLQNGDTLPSPATGQVDIIGGARINDNGVIAATADLANTSAPYFRRALFTYDGSALHTLLMSTDAAPGAPSGYTIGRGFGIVGFNANGDIAFTSTPSTLAGAFLTNTLYIRAGAGTLSRIVAVGDTAPGTNGGTFSSITPVVAATTLPTLNIRGEVLFTAAISGGNGGFGLFVGSTAGVRKVVSNGDTDPLGSTFSITNAPAARQNQAGQVAFVANGQVWIADSSSTLSKVAAHGDAGPSNLGGTLNVINSVVAMNDSGVVAFSASISGTTNYSNVVMTTTAGVQPQAVAWTGEAVPTVGGTFASFNAISFNVNSSGQISFFATISGGGSANGFFVGSGGGALTPAVFTGTSIPFSSPGTASFSNNGNFLSGSTILSDGSVFMSANILNSSTDDFAEFIYRPNISFYPLLADGTALPSGANTTLRTFNVGSAGDWVGFLGSYAGGALSVFVKNVATGTTFRVIGDGDVVGGNHVRVENLNTVFLAPNGQVAVGMLAVSGPLIDYIWDPVNGLSEIARIGTPDPVSSLAFTNLSALSLLPPTPMNSSGTLLLNACVSNSTTSCGVYTGKAGGALTRIVFDGDSNPDGGVFSTPRGIAINSSGQVLFYTGSSTAGAYYLYTPGTGFAPIVGTGSNGPNGTAFASFPVVLNFNPQGGILNNAGEFAFGATLSNGVTGYFVATPQTSPYAIALSTDTTPVGGTFANLNKLDISINDAHDVAFRADITGSNSNSGYFIRRHLTGPVQTVLAQGQTVPEGSATFDKQNTSANNVASEFFGFDATNQLYVFAGVLVGGVQTSNYYRYRTDNVLELAVGHGSAMPVTGGTITSLTQHPPLNAKHEAFWMPVVGGSAYHVIGGFAGDTNTSNADLALTVIQIPDSAPATGSGTVTFTAVNNGSATATAATLTISVPAGITITNAGTCTGTTTLTCALGDMTVGSSVQVVLSGTATIPGPQTITGTVASSVNDPNPANNTDSVTINVVNRLSVAITHLPEPAYHGQTVTYGITVVNQTGTADSTTTTFPLPTGAVYNAASSSATCSFASGVVTCTSGSLAANASASFTIVFTAPGPGAYPMTASVTASPAGNGSAQDLLTVNPLADLSASAGPVTTVTAGTGATFNVTVTNNGPDAASVNVNETLPPGFTFVSASWVNVGAGTNGSCTNSSGIACVVGTINAGATATVTTVATAGSTLGIYSLAATATSSNAIDTVPLNNSAAATVIVALSTNAREAQVVADNEFGLRLLDNSFNDIIAAPNKFGGGLRWGMKVTPNGRLAFIGNPFSGDIDVYDLSIQAVIFHIPASPSRDFALTSDGSTLVVPEGDSIDIIDTSLLQFKHQFTTVNLNGLVGDNPAIPLDILPSAPAIIGTKAYFNPSGFQNGSTTNGLPIIVLDLTTHVVSTIPLPVTSVGGGNKPTIAATPDGRYLFAMRHDGTYIIDLTNNSVVTTIAAATAGSNFFSDGALAITRGQGNPNVFAYLYSNTNLYIVDARTGSATFGTVLATVPQGNSGGYVTVSADGSTVVTDNNFTTETTTNVVKAITGQSGAATTTTFPLLDVNSRSAEVIDLTAIAGAPTVTSISPNSMHSDVTTAITVTGTNIASDVVFVGGDLTPTSVTSTQIQTTVPPGGATGTFDVTVTNPNSSNPGQRYLSGVLPSGFTLLPPTSLNLTDKIVAVALSQGVDVVNDPANPPSHNYPLSQTSLHAVFGSIAVTSDGGYALIPLRTGTNNTALVNLTNGSQSYVSLAAVPGSDSPENVVRSVDPTTHASVFYVADSITAGGYQLLKVDANPASPTFATALATISSGISAPFFPHSNSIAATPDGRYVYVALHGTGLTPNQQIFIFDTLSGTKVGNFGLTTVNAYPTQNGIVVTPDGKFLILLMSDNSHLQLFSLASPTAPVLQTTITTAVPTGYTTATISNYMVAKDRLYALGFATASTGSSEPFLEVFGYDPTANNFSLKYTYFLGNQQLELGQMLISSDGTKLYINGVSDDSVQVLDLTKTPFNDPAAILANLGAPYAPLQIATTYNPPAPSYNVALSMTHTPEPAARTGQVEFVVSASNNGADVTSATVTMPLPSGTSFVSLNPSCAFSSPNIVCTLGTLPGGLTETATFALTMPSTTGAFTATATFTSPETAANGNGGNNTAQTTVNIQNGADIQVTASASQAAVTAGGTVTFTANVTNVGPDPSGATVTGTLPSGFTLVSANFNNLSGNTSGSCSSAGSTITCNIGSLPYSGTPTTATITVVATAGSQLGLFSFGAAAAATTPDVNPLNNSANAPITVAVSTAALDTYIIDDNASAGLLFFNPGTLTQFNSIAQLMAAPRTRPVVSPNGRLLFTGSSYISVVDLSIKAEIRRINLVPSAAYTLTPDGKTLVVPVGDTVVLVDTATFQQTTINLNGVVGDDPTKNDILLGTPAIANGKAYFNPGGLRLNSATAGLPIIVVDLTSQAVSTVTLPTASRGAATAAELTAAATTADGHYLVAPRRDALLIVDLTTNTVVVRNNSIAPGGISVNVVAKRTLNDANIFAYVAVATGRIYQVDLRTTSATFGQVIGTATATTNVSAFGSLAPGFSHLSISANGQTVYSDDSAKTITVTTAASMSTSPSTAATNTILTGIDLNSSSLAIVDFSAVAGAPTVTSISPSVITTDGGVTVTVNGTNFAAGALVRFGQNPPLSTTFVSSTQLQVAIPAGVAAQSAMDVVVTNPNASSPVSQQNLSGILRGAATVELAAAVRLASPMVSSMTSNGVTFINRKSSFSAIPQNPLHEVQGVGQVTADGGYMFVPVAGDQVNSTTVVNGGVAIVNLSNGSTTFSLQPVATSFSNGISVVSSVNPSNSAPVMYLISPNSAQTDVTVEMLDANPASPTFGNNLGTFNANVTGNPLPATFGAAASANGRYVYAGWENGNVGGSTYQVLVFDILNQVIAGSFTPNTLGAANTQRLLTIAPDGNLLMVMANGQDIGVFSLTNPISPALIGTITGVLPSGSTSLSIASFVVNGNRVYVSGSGTNSQNVNTPSLELFNYVPGTPNFSLLNAYTGAPVIASGPLSVSSDGTQLYLSGASNDSVSIYDIGKLTSNDPTAFVASFGTPFGPTKFVSNNAASVPTTDLQGTITASPNPAILNGTVTYNFTVTNNGPLTATNIVFTDPLPASTVPVAQPTISCAGTTCSCNNASPVVCSVNTLISGASASGSIIATVPASLGSYTNTAQVVADQAASTNNNVFSVTNSVIAGADLSVSISQPTNPAVMNTSVTYTVTVTNNGPTAATGVVVQVHGHGNPFSTPTISSTPAATCTQTSPTGCTFASVASGATVTVTATTSATLPGSYSVLATVTANEPDPILTNNSAYQTTMFLPSATAASRFLVTDRASGRVRQYNVSNNAEVATANEPTAGFSVNAVAVMPNGRIGFTAQFGNYVSVIDFSLGHEINRIPVRARGLALTRDGSSLLITNALADELVVVNTTTYAIVNRISYNGLSGLGDNPAAADVGATAMAVVGSKVYLNASGRQFNLTTGFPIIVIDLNASTASVIAGSGVGTGFSDPNAIAATPDGQYVVALRSGTQFPIIDATTDSVVQLVTTFASGVSAMAITRDATDPRGNLAYISNGPRTNVLDLRQGSPTFAQFLIAGNGIAGTPSNTGLAGALSADGTRFYVSAANSLNLTAPQVDVYDTALLVSNPSTAFLGGIHISDFPRVVTTAITDTSVPAGAPTITSVAPSAVVNEQPTTITINGQNFSGDAMVMVGPSSLVAPNSVSPTQLQVTVPAGSPSGAVSIAVVNQNAASNILQQNLAAVLPNALTIEPPVTFAPTYQLVGHEAGDGSVFQIGRARQNFFVNQIALETGGLSPDGSNYWMPIVAGLERFNLDTQTGVVVTGIPTPLSIDGVTGSIDPTTAKPVVYLSNRRSGSPADPRLDVVDADPNSATFSQVIRSIQAGLNDNSSTWSLAVTPDGRYVYTGPVSGTNIVIYDTLTNTASHITCTSVSVVCPGLITLRLSPDGHTLIGQNTAGGISIMDVGTNPLVPTLTGTLTPTVPSGFSSVVLNLYAISSTGVVAADATQGIVEVFPAGQSSPTGVYVTGLPGDISTDFGLAVPPDGSLIYLAGLRSDNVYVLDTNKVIAADPNPVVATLAGGVGPSGLNVSSRTLANNDLSITMTAPAFAGASTNFTYQVSVHNGGSVAATGVTVLDNLNAATFVSATNATCSGGSNVSCSLASIPAGGTVNFTLTALAPASPPIPPETGYYVMHNTATVTANETDTNLLNNTASADTNLSQACAPGSGFDKAWTGAVNGDWNNANNWSPAGVPTSSNNVFVCRGGGANPTLSANATVNGLSMETGSVINLVGSTLTTGGNVAADTITATTGTLILGGTGTLGSVSLPNTQVSGTITATTAQNIGPLQVSGNLILNGQTVNVAGNFSTTGSGILTATNPADVLNVNGAVSFNGGDTTNSLSAGRITLTGNFSAGGTTTRNFAPADAGSFQVVFNGTTAQTVFLTGPGSSFDQQHFHHLTASNPAGVAFASPVYINGDVTLSGPVTGVGQTAVLGGNVFDSTGDLWQVSNTVITGATPQLARMQTAMSMPSTVTLPAGFTLDGPLTVGGNLILNGQSVTVNGDFQTTGGSGILTETNPADTLIVHGNVTFNGGDTSQSLSAGVLQLTGNFVAAGSTSRNFAPQDSGTHRVRLTGTTQQTVSFVGPGSAFDQQHFHDLEINNASGVTLLSDTYVNGSLFVTSGVVSATTTLIVHGDLSDTQGGRVQVGSLILTGGSPALPSLIASPLNVTTPLILQNDITVNSSVVVSTNLTLNGHTMTINGDFQTTGAGILTEVNPADALIVHGNVAFLGGDTTQSLSTGLIQLTGNFSAGPSTGRNFAPQSNGNHLVRFTGSTETVSFVGPGSAFDQQHFQYVEFATSGSVNLISATYVNKDVTISGGTVTGSVVAVLGGNLSDSVGDRWQVQQTQITSSSPSLSRMQTNLTVLSSATLPSGFVLDGALTVTGNLILNGHSVTVNGDFSTAGGILTETSANDALFVNGNVTFNGGDTTQSLSAGLLQLTGNFSAGSSSARNFAPQSNGTHLVRFAGSGAQSVSFVGPGSAFDNQHFQDVEFAGPGTVTLASTTYVNGNVTVNGGIVNGNVVAVLAGDISDTVGDRWQVAQTQMTGSAPHIAKLQTAMTIVNSSTLPVGFTVDGPLTVAGNLVLNNQLVTVNGDFQTTGSGILTAVNSTDTLIVNGNVTFNGGDTSTSLAAGLLQLTGSFTAGTSSGRNFAPQANGSFLVRFTGSGVETVSFAAPGTQFDQQHFVTLEIANVAGGSVNIASAVFANTASLTTPNAVLTGATLYVTGAFSSVAGSQMNATVSPRGSINLQGTSNSGTFLFDQTNQLIQGNLPNVQVTGTVSIAGPTTVSGSLTISSGSLNLQGQVISVAGNFSTTGGLGGGALISTSSNASLTVAGNASLTGDTVSPGLTAGTLTVGGNFTAATKCCTSGTFLPSGSFKVVLNGGLGQTVTVDPLDTFQDLTIANTSGGVNFVNGANISGSLLVTTPTTLTGGALNLTSPSGTISTVVGSSLANTALSLTGSMSISGGYSVATTTFTGSGAQSIQALPYGSLVIAGTGTASFTGPTNISQDLTVSSGTLDLSGQTITVGRNFSTTGGLGAGALVSTANASLSVAGSATFNGNTVGPGTIAGTLSVAGNFVAGTKCCSSGTFLPSGTFKVVLNGSAAQTVTVDPLDNFQDLQVLNTAGVSFTTGAQVSGALTIANGSAISLGGNINVAGAFTSTAATTVTGTGQTLFAASVNVAGLTLNDVLFGIGSGTFTQFNFVTFQNEPAAATQLTIQNPGSVAPLVMNNVQFLTTPAGGGLYISAIDTAPNDGVPLVINLQHNFPLDGSALTAVSGATVNWLGNFADLSISAAASGNILQGNDETYTFTISNAGPDDAGTVTFTDVIPAGTTYVSATMGGTACSFASGTVTCTAAALANGASVTATVVLHPTISGPITNVGSVAGVSHDSNSGNNTASANITVAPSADLALSIGGSAPQTQIGSTYTYTITVQNNGPSDATNVVVTDTLPSTEVISGVTASQGTCTVSTVSCNLGTITNGSSATVTVLVFISGVGPIVNSAGAVATETDVNTVNNNASFTVPSIAADLAMSGTGPASTLLGSNISYAFTIVNNGPNDAVNVTMNDTMPAGVTFVSAAINGTPCSATPTTITCSLSTLTANSSATVNVVLHPTGTGSVVNNANVGSSTADQNPQNNPVSITTSVSAAADLALSMAATPAQAQPGTTVTYTIAVQNNGPSDATNVTVADSLPIGITFGSATATQGTCVGTTSLSCSLGTVTNGSTVTITVVGQVTSAGVLVSNASVSATETDTNTTNNAASATTSSTASDVAISGSAATGVLFGANETYTFTIVNNGPNDAGATTFTDTIPAGPTFVSASVGATPCSFAAGTITCAFASFAQGASATITVVLHPTASGTLVNSASVSGTVFDTNTANNGVAITSTISPSADLSVTGTATPTQAQPGAQITYTLSVQNAGPSSATNVVLTDALPSGVTFVSAVPSQGSCSAVTTITCSLGSLANGSHVTITIVGQITLAGSLPDNASVTATEADVNTANNSATITTTSIAADLAITTSPSGSLNGVPSYTAVITNNGPSDATNVVVTAVFDRYTFVSASSTAGTCSLVVSTLTCTGISLPKGTSISVIIAVQPPNGGWATINFSAHSDQFDPNPTNNATQIAPSTEGMNTLTGSNITVDASDSGGSAVVNFAQVVTPGSTSLATAPLSTAPPAGFRTGTAAVYFDVATSAQFSGLINLAFRFAPNAFHHPSRVRLFHMEGGQWVDRTTGMNLATGTIAAVTTSLSPFAIFEPVNTVPVANAGGTRVVTATAMSGTALRLDGSGSTDADGDALTYRWSGPFPEGNGKVTGVNPSVTLPIGNSQLTLVVNDGEVDSAPATVSVSVADFMMAVNGNASITRGQSASYSVALSPVYGAFDAPVTLSCGNLPAGMSCSFSQATITPGASGATATLTINTTVAFHQRRGPALAMWLGLMLGPIGLTWAGRNRRATLLVLLIVLVILAVGVGCGGGGGVSGAPTSSTTTTTPAQTVTITVTGTSAGVQHSATTAITLR